MKTEERIYTISAIIGGGLPMFDETVRTTIVDNWRIIVFGIGIFSLIMLILSTSVRRWVKRDFKDEIQNVTKKNEDLAKFIQLGIDNYNINSRITRDIILKCMFNNETNKKVLAQHFYKLGFNKNELSTYGIDEEIINLMLTMYHTDELNKLENKNSK